MAKRFDILPGGKIKQFRNRPARCSCSKKTPGRPGVTRGICHGVGRRASRNFRLAERRDLQRLRSGGFSVADLEDLAPPRQVNKFVK
jgi:hypothetical protein